MSRAIVDSLRITLTEEEDQKLVHDSGHNAFAYDTYLRVRRDIWIFKKANLDRARAELEHALQIVGDDVLLYRGLGVVNWQYVNAGISGDPAYLEEAERYARKIIELDPPSCAMECLPDSGRSGHSGQGHPNGVQLAWLFGPGTFPARPN